VKTTKAKILQIQEIFDKCSKQINSEKVVKVNFIDKKELLHSLGSQNMHVQSLSIFVGNKGS
jgi:hypothetical protein